MNVNYSMKITGIIVSMIALAVPFLASAAGFSAITDWFVSPAGSRIYSPTTENDCPAGFVYVGGVTDCQGVNCTWGNEAQCVKIQNVTTNSCIVDLFISSPDSRIVSPTQGDCPAGFIYKGGWANCTNATCYGNQILCIKTQKNPSSCLTDVYISAAGSRIFSPSQRDCPAGYELKGAWADCQFGTCYGNQVECVKVDAVPQVPLSCRVTINKNPIQSGTTTNIKWTSAGSPTAFYINSMGWVGASGSSQVGPSQTTDYSGKVYQCPSGYTLSADGTQCTAASGSSRTRTTTNSVPPTTATCPATLTVNAASCPVGYHVDLILNLCVINSATTCASGYHLDTSTNTCVPDVTLEAATTAWGFSSLIHWDASNANSCTGTGFNTNGATSGTITTNPLLQTTTFTLVCDTGTKSVTVVIDSCPAGYVGTPPVCTLASETCPVGYTGTPPNCSIASSCPLNYTGTPPNCIPNSCNPSNICNGNNVVNSCTGAVIQSCAYSCANGACLVPAPSVVSWTVAPLIVSQGSATNVSWEVRNVSSCTVSGTNGDSWTGLTGTKVSGPINSQTVFTLHCTALSGSGAPNVTRTATVNIVPVFEEK